MARISATLLPSIGNMVFLSVLMILVFGTGNGLLYDGDTGYHIRTGEVILESWRIPTHDIFSAHDPALEWTAHEWLAEATMATVFKISGLTGVVLFFAILLSATPWLLFLILRSKSNDFILVIATTFLATATSSSHWLARPHAFSLLFTLVWYYLLDRFQYDHRRTLIYLPLLMVCWVNLHGGYFFGLVLLSIYLAGNLLHSLSGSPQQVKFHREKVKHLFRYLLITIVACLINPIGYEILRFPVKLTSNRFLMDHVIEFLSPNFHEILPFKYMFLATIGALSLSRKPLNLIQAGLLLVLSYMALYSARHASLFAIIAAPLLLKQTESLIEHLPVAFVNFYQTRNRNLAQIDSNVRGYLWPAFSVACAIGLALAGSLRFTFNEKRFPVAAIEFLKQEAITGNMFNDDEFGDYIIYSAWPKYRVFMDGRSDMYGEKLGAAYLKVANLQPGWREVLSHHKVSWIIFETNSALTAALQDDTKWRAIYSDRVATIFVKKDSAHESLLAKYPAVALAGSK